MTNGIVTSANLGDKMLEAAKTSFGAKFKVIEHFVKAESEKLAITLRMIIEARDAGQISKEEASILLNGQKVSAIAVLTAAEGMTAVAAQAALNASLNVVKEFVNSKLGFTLL